MDYPLKFVDDSDDQIEGMLVPFGGIFQGRDVQGEYFSSRTDLHLDLFDTRPLMFHHGLDPEVGVKAVGRITSVEQTDKGYWMRAWLDKRAQYYDAIKKMIGEKALELSAGSMGHLTKVSKSGEILVWPLFEGSLTPTPACPELATVDFATAKSHFKSAGIEIDFDALKAKMDAAERDALSDSDFAYVDSDGNRHLPINDADHVRAALARFDQTQFGSDAAKEAARRKIAAAAKKFGVEVSSEDAAAKKSADLAVKSMEGSYEDLIEDLAALLNPQTPFGPDCYSSIVATYEGYVIACRYDYAADPDECQTYWKVAYVIGDDGEPTLGEATAVEQTYVPAKSYTSDSPLTLDAQNLSRHAGALSERTKDLQERRIKAGRVLSTANRQQLTDAVKNLDAAKSTIQGLLDASDQLGRDQAEAKALIEPAALQRRLAALSLFLGDEPAP